MIALGRLSQLQKAYDLFKGSVFDSVKRRVNILKQFSRQFAELG